MTKNSKACKVYGEKNLFHLYILGTHFHCNEFIFIHSEILKELRKESSIKIARFSSIFTWIMMISTDLLCVLRYF